VSLRHRLRSEEVFFGTEEATAAVCHLSSFNIYKTDDYLLYEAIS
jgi:hypothetical protein